MSSLPVSIIHQAKGAAMIRYAVSLIVNRGNFADAAAYAATRYGENAAPARFTKAAMSAATTDPTSWGAALADYTANGSELTGLVKEQSLLSRLPGLRAVPLVTRLLIATSGASAGWIGQAAPIPVSNIGFTGEKMTALQCAALVVVSLELVKSLNPVVEPLLIGEVTRTLAAEIDRTFLSSSAGVANVQPAGVAYGVVPITPGATPSDDVTKLLAAFRGDLGAAVFVASPARFAAMSSANLPNIGARGGDLKGIPAVKSLQAGNSLFLIDPKSIAIGYDILRIDVSDEATIQMIENPATGDTTQTSLWQNNLSSIRAVQYMNWKVLRPGAVELVAYPA